jgi:hypothetical protein
MNMFNTYRVSSPLPNPGFTGTDWAYAEATDPTSAPSSSRWPSRRRDDRLLTAAAPGKTRGERSLGKTENRSNGNNNPRSGNGHGTSTEFRGKSKNNRTKLTNCIYISDRDYDISCLKKLSGTADCKRRSR